jgi:hypothetical protein
MSKLVKGQPVESLSITFRWHEGDWMKLFDAHVTFIQQDIRRALAANRLVVYLSCPISSRGGSYSATNVEIANYTAERLSVEWGPRFWFLNPAQYQMESAQGLGLIRMHANALGLAAGAVDALLETDPPSGGDYMRMWTRVLAEDDKNNWGARFSAFYFIAPSDSKRFFAQTGATNTTAGVESYFAEKYATDQQFREYFTGTGSQAEEAESRRREFFRYYTVRAGANFSMGSHDEWNIWRELNERRICGPTDEGFGIGSQIAGYFEGIQIVPGAAERPITPGYAIDGGGPSPAPTLLPQTAPLTPAVKRLAGE